MNLYYLDTCIWRDFYENRIGFQGRSLGKIAAKFIEKIIARKDIIFYSELTIKELMIDYNKDEINNMFQLLILMKTLKSVKISKEDYLLAKEIALKKNVPHPDALHAILSKKCNAILILQDNHTQLLKEYVQVKKPEEII